MCRTYGAQNHDYRGSQPFRAGLCCGAPPALGLCRDRFVYVGCSPELISEDLAREARLEFHDARWGVAPLASMLNSLVFWGGWVGCRCILGQLADINYQLPTFFVG